MLFVKCQKVPKFSFTAKSFDGKTKQGELEVKDEKSLAQELRSEGFLVTSIKALKETPLHCAKSSTNFWAAS